jgi:amino acid adenylation domain-containing protein
MFRGRSTSTEALTPAALHAFADANCVIEAFRAVAQVRRDSPAIIENGRVTTYAELAAKTQIVASRLGENCGTVAVLTTRSANTVVALLGVLTAGGIYCPVDPRYPDVRQEAMMRAGGCSTIIATGAALPIKEGRRVLTVEAHIGGGDRPDHELVLEHHPDLPAYLLFSSGSTGRPKGVLVSRRALFCAVRSLSELLQISVSDRVLQFASLSWDTCFEEIVPALTAGASIVIDDDAFTGAHARTLRMIRERGVTVLNLPTAYWHELVIYMAEFEPDVPKSLRLVVIGGEVVHAARLAEWCSLDTAHIRLVNTYGCTETTLVTHAVDLHGPRAEPRSMPWSETHAVPIGTPLPHVIDHIAENGELMIGGPALAVGYVNLPELTTARFVQTNLGRGDQRYYRTGDRVSRLKTGSLVHHGRMDDELKIRGVRVHPGEVESAISSHPEVKEAAVVGVRRGDHSALVAYIVPRDTAAAKHNIAVNVSDFLRDQLPKHLIPAKINVVRGLPHTASGKVDRSRLREPTVEKKAERTGIAQIIAIFRQLLATEDIHAGSDFFVSGGDSLLATRVLSALARDFKVELTLKEFMAAPSPSALFEQIGRRQG